MENNSANQKLNMTDDSSKTDIIEIVCYTIAMILFGLFLSSFGLFVPVLF